jgi:hypothetical protein
MAACDDNPQPRHLFRCINSADILPAAVRNTRLPDLALPDLATGVFK